MRAALALLLVTVAGIHAQVFQNVCKPTEIVFLLDHSENARKASTPENAQNFQLLISAWESYMNALQIRGNSLFRIWAWAYSSRAVPQELVQRNSSPSQCRGAPLGQLSSGGSWTYKGMEQIINARPSLPNNIVIIISAQGSMNAGRRSKAQADYDQLARSGWNTYVIGVKSSDIIDNQELTIVNGNRNPVILDDGRTSNKKSYSLLPDALTTITNTILCPSTIITQPPVIFTTPRPTIPIRTLPPSTGICSNCKVSGGYGFDVHRTYCDSFYQCMPDGSYILKHCAQSLFWDNSVGTCVRTSQMSCPMGVCNAQNAGRTYPSGGCCNMYFLCDGSVMSYKQCPSDQIYDTNARRCASVSDPIAACAARGSYYCNDRKYTGTIDCGNYGPDPLGNPCKFYHNNIQKETALGTMWDQATCSLKMSDGCLTQNLNTRGLQVMSNTCTALVMSTWESGKPDCFSERDPTLPLHVQLNSVIKARGALVFRPNLQAANAYYYFFNNNNMPYNSGFRLVFQLDSNARTNVEYALLSNNYCPDCPETIGMTVRQTGGSSCEIMTKFTDSSSQSIVQTRTQISSMQSNGWLSLNVIWGANDVHGVVKVLNSNKRVMNTVQIPPVQHTPLGTIQSNKCGILLGDGPSTVFVGQMDEFAYYSSCQNIDDILA